MATHALLLVAVGGILWCVVRVNLMSAADRSLARRAGRMTARFQEDPDRFEQLGFRGQPYDSGRTDRSTQPALPLSLPDLLRARLVRLDGNPFSARDPAPPLDRSAILRAAAGHEIYTTVRLQGQDVRVISNPVMRGHAVVGIVQLAVPLQDSQRELAGLTRALVMLIPVALLLSGLSGVFFTARMMHPVRRMAHAAREIGAHNLSERLPEVGDDEFTDLARAFNALLRRLERAFEQERLFIADASHELRTPLTAILAHTSLAMEGERTPAAYRRAVEGTQRSAMLMNRIVQDLLLLARLDTGRASLSLSPISIRSVLEDAVEMVKGYSKASIQLVCDAHSPEVCADADHLLRLFVNLLDNAARHTPEDGKITVASERAPGIIRITVSDTGVGIDPAHLPYLQDRFYRVEPARERAGGGAGLGLAICKSIVAAHSGTMSITSQPENGTCVTVTLPLL
jgi:heavy metal sensor kinase